MNPLELQVLTLLSRSGTPADIVNGQGPIPRLPVAATSALFGPPEVVANPAAHEARLQVKPLTL